MINLYCIVFIVDFIILHRYLEWVYQKELRLNYKEPQEPHDLTGAINNYWAEEMIKIIEGPQVLNKLLK